MMMTIVTQSILEHQSSMLPFLHIHQLLPYRGPRPKVRHTATMRISIHLVVVVLLIPVTCHQGGYLESVAIETIQGLDVQLSIVATVL